MSQVLAAGAQPEAGPPLTIHLVTAQSVELRVLVAGIS